jgi:hypothetical protein
MEDKWKTEVAAINELSFDEFQRIYGRSEALKPHEAVEFFAAAPFRWWIAAGWSLDLEAPQRRVHEDLEVAVPREDLGAVREWFHEFHLWDVHAGTLRHLSVGAGLADDHEQLWVRRDAFSPWLMDLMLTPVRHGMWFYKRDERVSRPLTEAVLETAGGIPYQAPAVSLLFKARRRAAKDEADFAAVAPALPPAERTWLREAVALTEPPGHPWVARL